MTTAAPVKNWVISVKGYFSDSVIDPGLKKRFQDIRYGYGTVYFTGTQEECDALEMEMFYKGVKIIGTKEGETVEYKAKKADVFSLVSKAGNKCTALENKYRRIEKNENGGRYFTPEEQWANKVYRRIFNYYVKNYC